MNGTFPRYEMGFWQINKNTNININTNKNKGQKTSQTIFVMNTVNVYIRNSVNILTHYKICNLNMKI